MTSLCLLAQVPGVGLGFSIRSTERTSIATLIAIQALEQEDQALESPSFFRGPHLKSLPNRVITLIFGENAE